MVSSPDKIVDVENTRYSRLPVYAKVVFLIFTIAGIGLAVFTIFGFTFGGRTLFDAAYYYLLIALFLPLVFLVSPFRKKDKGRLRWYDIVLAVLAFGSCLYLYTQAYSIVMTGWYPVDTPMLIVSCIVLLLVLEAARRGYHLPDYIPDIRSVSPVCLPYARHFVRHELFFPGYDRIQYP